MSLLVQWKQWDWSDIVMTETKRGAPAVIHMGYLYQLAQGLKPDLNKTLWRCAGRFCTGRLWTTEGLETPQFLGRQDHVAECVCSRSQLKTAKLKTDAKLLMRAERLEAPAIYQQMVDVADFDAEIELPEYDVVRKFLFKARYLAENQKEPLASKKEPKLVWTCNICGCDEFSSSKRLRQHKTEVHVHSDVHASTSDFTNTPPTCGRCGLLSFDLISLCDHLKIQHKEPVEVLRKKFESFKDFVLWKKREEFHNRSHYAKCSMPRSATDTRPSEYYVCSQSKGMPGCFRRGGRHFKVGGLKPGTFTCSGFMILQHDANRDEVLVTYCLRHYGHGATARAPMAASQKRRALQLLAQRRPPASVSTILNAELAETLIDVPEKRMISPNDVKNLKRSHKTRRTKRENGDNDFNRDPNSFTFLDSEPDSPNHRNNCKQLLISRGKQSATAILRALRSLSSSRDDLELASRIVSQLEETCEALCVSPPPLFAPVEEGELETEGMQEDWVDLSQEVLDVKKESS